jgi:hypothetical protein
MMARTTPQPTTRSARRLNLPRAPRQPRHAARPSTTTTSHEARIALGVVWLTRSTSEPLSRAQIGAQIGADPVTLDRVLASAVRDGLVTRAGGAFAAPSIRDLGLPLAGRRW